jgi:hypothetical protein
MMRKKLITCLLLENYFKYILSLVVYIIIINISMILSMKNIPNGAIEHNNFFDMTLTCKIYSFPNNSRGTGFFYKSNNNLFIVTNKHVVCFPQTNNNNIIIHYIHKVNNGPAQTTMQITLNNNNLFVHEEESCDLCMIKININDDVFSLNNNNILDMKQFLELCDNNIITMYPTITMKGYVEDTIYPFNRNGSLTTNIFENCYEYLGDITSIGGYSGSPVFIKFLLNGLIYYIFLGINRGYIPEYKKVFTTKQQKEIETDMYIKENTRQAILIRATKILDIKFEI